MTYRIPGEYRSVKHVAVASKSAVDRLAEDAAAHSVEGALRAKLNAAISALEQIRALPAGAVMHADWIDEVLAMIRPDGNK